LTLGRVPFSRAFTIIIILIMVILPGIFGDFLDVLTGFPTDGLAGSTRNH
jgi:hypothetical protein